MDTKQTLTVNIYDAIKRDIIDGRLKAGQKLKINDLKENYQTASSPVREALSRLASTGLVIAENQKGFHVKPISQEELEDLYHAKQLIDCLLLSESITQGDDQWEANMLASFHRISKLEVSEKSINPYEWEQRNREFHCALTSTCRSQTLHEIEQQLFEKTQRYRHIWIKDAVIDKQVLKKNNREHKALLNAALARDVDKAQLLHTKHIKKSLEASRKICPIRERV